MQNPIASTIVFPAVVHAADQPVGHVDGTIPVHPGSPLRPSIPKPKPAPNQRRRPELPEAEVPAAFPEEPGHAIDDYA